jgi:chromosome partitioning protein
MAFELPMDEKQPQAGSAHVIVLGNEKGGSGKSTTAMHIVVALLKSGYRVAAIDTDSRQRSLSRYIENRVYWARHTGLSLEIPGHFVVELGDGQTIGEIEAQQFAGYIDIIDQVERQYDFVVVDTPGSNSHLMRVSHAMADTLVTPVNDSFLDLDVLGRLDPESLTVLERSHYATLVGDAIEERRMIDGAKTDWVVVRNRLSTLSSRNQQNVIAGLAALSGGLGLRVADGISERVIFREFFPFGLTAFDTFDRRTLGSEPTMSHVAGRREIRELIDCLRLPLPAGRILAPEPPAPPASIRSARGGASASTAPLTVAAR